MKLKNNLGLIGMMGAGKSTIGKVVAKKMNLKFIDTDDEITKLEKKSIRKIFELYGEKYFREKEEKIITKLLDKDQVVIAYGGGSFLNREIRRNILDNSMSFWLSWKKNTIIKRIITNYKRPKVINLTKKDLSDMIDSRSNIYQQADHKIDCENLNKNEIAEKIISLYNNE